MPVRLNELPAELAPPEAPRLIRWCVAALVVALALGGLLLWCWPPRWAPYTQWSLLCATLLPCAAGTLLVALRMRAFERGVEYTRQWNAERARQARLMTAEAQRPLAVLAMAYCTAAGCNQLGRALASGLKPLQPLYLPTANRVVRCSQLELGAEGPAVAHYRQRLVLAFEQLATLLGPPPRLRQDTPVYLRLRHDGALANREVIALWQAVLPAWPLEVQGALAGPGGLMWLDTWLDAERTCAVVLSLEINLFLQPREGEAEHVSAVLLAHPAWRNTHGVPALAHLHRPVAAEQGDGWWAQALNWGRLAPGAPAPFTWASQVPAATLARLDGLAPGQVHGLDASLGRPGKAAGQLALMAALADAQATAAAQCVLLGDGALHGCVVQPVTLTRNA
ncbi:hypothetical protein [Pseudomonas sp. NPDC007930]|uniref:hypothetical protein n=1 Tax=Pseudomonas sp. NPDC007930 TaxID=3364417 RepID=UPI0036EE8883